ncbi:MAG: hypothetical protein COA42_02865 [Alteromonadaceae bacterium]|nr:MAG: hypothetical protein COA42_02865 [Alteromonadaceae bacterium]
MGCYCVEAGLSAPRLSERGDFVDWEFPRSPIVAGDGINDGISADLPAKYHALLALLQQQPSIAASTLAQELNIGTATGEHDTGSVGVSGSIPLGTIFLRLKNCTNNNRTKTKTCR